MPGDTGRRRERNFLEALLINVGTILAGAAARVYHATFAVALSLETLISNPRDSLFGIGIMFIGAPAYFYWTRASARSQPKDE